MHANTLTGTYLRHLSLAGLLLLSACTVGPFEIAYRGELAQSEEPSADIARTVTAVLATNTHIAVLRTATAQAQPFNPTAAPLQPTLPQVPTQPPAPPADLRLVYDEASFTLTNISGIALDITALSFQSDRGTLSSATWDNGYLTAPLYALPTGDCLMTWSVNTEEQPKPGDCHVRHAWTAVRDQEAFWRTDTAFTVYWNGQAIATCQGIAGVCPVSLP